MSNCKYCLIVLLCCYFLCKWVLVYVEHIHYYTSHAVCEWIIFRTIDLTYIQLKCPLKRKHEKSQSKFVIGGVNHKIILPNDIQ